jgi:predicted outer membrane protein
MRRIAVLFLCTAVLGGCARENARSQGPPFDVKKFLTLSLQTTMADADLGGLAAKKGRLAETRQLGAMMQREQEELRRALQAAAQRKGVPPPQAVEEKKRALKDNLLILPGQVFDRGYSLAMVQDLNALIESFRAAAASGDTDLVPLARQYLPRLAAQQKEATRVLDRLGGSPFGYPPGKSY